LIEDYSPLMLGRRWLYLPMCAAAVAALGACTSNSDGTAEPSPTTSPSSTTAVKTTPANIKLMQFNIEYGGTVVDFNSVPKAIKAADADVVALQEGYGNTCKVAKALHWPFCDPRTQTVSKYPVIQPADPDAPETLVEVSPGSVCALVNVHLPSTGYGPNRSVAGATPKELIAGERQRMKAIQPAIDAATRLEDAGTPVVIAGDFNSPSHRDWVEETVGLRDQVQVVDWPVSEAVEAAGLTDVYRSVHPDPVKD